MKFETQTLPDGRIRKGKKREEGIKAWAWMSRRIKLTDKRSHTQALGHTSLIWT